MSHPGCASLSVLEHVECGEIANVLPLIGRQDDNVARTHNTLLQKIFHEQHHQSKVVEVLFRVEYRRQLGTPAGQERQH